MEHYLLCLPIQVPYPAPTPCSARASSNCHTQPQMLSPAKRRNTEHLHYTLNVCDTSPFSVSISLSEAKWSYYLPSTTGVIQSHSQGNDAGFHSAQPSSQFPAMWSHPVPDQLNKKRPSHHHPSPSEKNHIPHQLPSLSLKSRAPTSDLCSPRHPNSHILSLNTRETQVK